MKDRKPVNAFWRLHPQDEVLMAITLYGQNPAEHTYYVPTGDTISYGEVMAFLKQRYKIDIRWYKEPRKPITNWQKSTILIGGGKSNITTRYLLAALNPPFYGRDHEVTSYDLKGLKNRKKEIVIQADRTRGKEYAYIIRTLDPYHQEQHVFLLIGAFTAGTYAATQWLANTKNLRWLWRACLWQRFKDFIRRSRAFDSLQIVLQVRVSTDTPQEVLPSIEDTKVWFEKERTDTKSGWYNLRKRKKIGVHFFHTPSDYTTAYEERCDIHKRDGERAGP